MSDLLHKRPRAKAEDARALPQVFEEETHLRHRPPLLAVHRSASRGGGHGANGAGRPPRRGSAAGAEGRTEGEPLAAGQGPGMAQASVKRAAAAGSGSGGGRGGTGRGGTTSDVAHNTVRDAAGAWLFSPASLGENGRSSVSASPGEPLRSSRGCSRVRASRDASAFRCRCVVPAWASSNSRSAAPRPPASLPGSDPKAERLASSGPCGVLRLPLDSGFGRAPEWPAGEALPG